MSNGVVIVRLLGRFGNQCIQYAFARAYAEATGQEFQCDAWIGQKVFEITDNPIRTPANALTRRSELDLVHGERNIDFMGYAQNELAMIYTLRQMRQWFTLREEHRKTLQRLLPVPDLVVAHRRVGDYFGYGYPVVSKQSYETHWACSDLSAYGEPPLQWITEENPTLFDDYPGELSFLPDFWRLMNARILYRGNSTFSWLAACLNENGKIFSPLIDGKTGGLEHACEFMQGNHPRLANFAFTRDMRVKE